jgi:hypothetical protein
VTVVRGKARPTDVIVVYGPVNNGVLTITVPVPTPPIGGCVTVTNGKPAPVVVIVTYGPVNVGVTVGVTIGVLRGLLTITVPNVPPGLGG